MPIEIYTGKPGNGKTAFMLERMMQEAAKKNPRPLVAYGVDDLKPGFATVLKDVTKWNDIDPHGEPECDCPEPGDKTETKRPLHAHVVRNGSLVFVDEAWKWFGHLHDASRQATPPHVLALAEHRHRGLDFIWTAQGPNQIYPFARPLIADHYHCVRRFGSKFIDVFKWGELQEQVKSASTRENSERSTKALPKAVFGMYKSADVHTIKTKIPAKVWGLPLMVVLAGGLLYFGIQMAKPSTIGGKNAASMRASAQAGADASGGSLTGGGGAQLEPETPGEYAVRHLPRFPTMPHTAPIYDGRSVTADPLIYCMSTGPGIGADGKHRPESVTCLTEQGTRYDLPDDQARHVARWGQPYNAYRDRERFGGGGPQQDQQFPMPASVVAPTLAAMGSSQVNGYGDLGIVNRPGP